MVLTKKKGHFYGDSHPDIRDRLLTYSRENGYAAEHFADPVCVCGGQLFNLLIDENEGAAVRVCTACQHEHPMGDSEEFLENAELEECECLCGSGRFELTVGVALYEGSEDVRWLYIGCRCPACGLTACYADWKNESEGYADLLGRV
jgi:hypothetical protein